MALEITGRQTAVTPRLRQKAELGLEQIGKIVGRVGNCHVILTEEKHRKIAEVTLQGAAHDFVGTAEGADMETALHDALAKVEQQAVRHNQKQTAGRRHPKEDLKTASDNLVSEEIA